MEEWTGDSELEVGSWRLGIFYECLEEKFQAVNTKPSCKNKRALE